MEKYFLFLVASGIVLSVAFSQCTSSAAANRQVTTQNDVSMLEKASEAQLIAKSMPIDKSASLVGTEFALKLVKASIKGTSTLHDWESQVTEIEGKGSFQVQDKLLSTIQDVEVKITVKGIKSEEGKKMDSKTYEAFKSEENPFIIYAFDNAEVNISASNVVTISAAGDLSMAGTSKQVVLKAVGKELSNGDLQLSVSQKIKMTDYGIKPPVMFLGTIKVGDEITVNFEFELTKLQK